MVVMVESLLSIMDSIIEPLRFQKLHLVRIVLPLRLNICDLIVHMFARFLVTAASRLSYSQRLQSHHCNNYHTPLQTRQLSYIMVDFLLKQPVQLKVQFPYFPFSEIRFSDVHDYYYAIQSSTNSVYFELLPWQQPYLLGAG